MDWREWFGNPSLCNCREHGCAALPSVGWGWDSSLLLHTLNLFWLPLQKETFSHKSEAERGREFTQYFTSEGGEMSLNFPERTMYTEMQNRARISRVEGEHYSIFRVP